MLWLPSKITYFSISPKKRTRKRIISYFPEKAVGRVESIIGKRCDYSFNSLNENQIRTRTDREIKDKAIHFKNSLSESCHRWLLPTRKHCHPRNITKAVASSVDSLRNRSKSSNTFRTKENRDISLDYHKALSRLSFRCFPDI